MAAVGHELRHAATGPGRFQIAETDLEHDHTQRPVRAIDPARQIQARLVAHHPESEMRGIPTRHGLREIGPEAVIMADEGIGCAPVAGRHRPAGHIQHIDDGRPQIPPQNFQPAAQVFQSARLGGLEHARQGRVLRQHTWNGAVLVELVIERGQAQLGRGARLGFDIPQSALSRPMAGAPERPRQQGGSGRGQQPARRPGKRAASRGA
ncbi:hypothetical protein [Castellaniella ginsengisoli]|uniref:hypothetical protein n=1 Tax=Castellaniella ginsengisoli TaxID=546114 RepID=UPI0034CFC496